MCTEPQKTTYNQSQMGKENLLKHSVLKYVMALDDILCVNLKQWKEQKYASKDQERKKDGDKKT